MAGLLAVEPTIRGNADMHAIESIEIEQRRVSGCPSVIVRCDCNGVFDMREYSDHVATAIWKALREAGVRDLIDVAPRSR